MNERAVGLLSALSWFAFPMVPALLGGTFHRALNPVGGDPRDWEWATWALLSGPLLGYGFLAGATLGLPDDPARRGPKGWLSSRSLWVAAGPWAGVLAWPAFLLAFRLSIAGPYFGALVVAAIASIAYGWVVVAYVMLRRARRRGRLWESLRRGLALAFGFVGSLFGSFWAITEAWRAYFFDARTFPILLAAVGLTILAGCDATVTYGEVRRRELFDAMLMAWLIGLALAWRWWSRPRS